MGSGGGPGIDTGGVRDGALGALFAARGVAGLRGAAGLRGVAPLDREAAGFRGAREAGVLAAGRAGFDGTAGVESSFDGTTFRDSASVFLPPVGVDRRAAQESAAHGVRADAAGPWGLAEARRGTSRLRRKHPASQAWERSPTQRINHPDPDPGDVPGIHSQRSSVSRKGNDAAPPLLLPRVDL